MDVVSILPKLSGTGVDVPNLPNSPVPVLPAVCLGTYRTEHTLFCMLFKRYPLDYQLTKKVKIKKRTVSLNLNEYQSFAFIGLILMRVRFQASLYFGEVEKTKLDFVCAN